MLIDKSDTYAPIDSLTGTTFTERRDLVSGSYGPWYVTGAVSGLNYSLARTGRIRSWKANTLYRSLVKAGTALPDLPFSYSFYEVKFGKPIFYGPIIQGFMYQYRRVYRVGGPQWNPLPTVPPNPLGPSAIVSKLIDKAKGNQFNAPVFVAEAGKTASMVYSRALSIVNLFRAARRGNFSYFFDNLHITRRPTHSQRKRLRRKWNKRFTADSTKAAADVVLEFNYGWVPFMLEVRSAVNTLMDLADRPESRVMRVRADSHVETTVTVLKETWDFGIDGKINIERKDAIKHSIRGVWRFEPLSADLPGRFGMVNPAEVIWELIPLSFVVDWFLPIGDYLSALDTRFRFSHRGGVYGYRTEIKSTWKPHGPPFGANMTISGDSSGTCYRVNVNRSVMLEAPSAKLISFGYDPQLNATRVTSAIALLRQIVPNLIR